MHYRVITETNYKQFYSIEQPKLLMSASIRSPFLQSGQSIAEWLSYSGKSCGSKTDTTEKPSHSFIVAKIEAIPTGVPE